MDFQNNFLLDILKHPKFKLSMINGILNEYDTLFFKQMLKNLIYEKGIFLNKAFKKYIKINFLKKDEINVTDINMFILLVYILIKFNNAFINPILWENPIHYNEYNIYKLHENFINQVYFENNEINPNILNWLIYDFKQLNNHYLFKDYFVYTLQLGLTINLKINMLHYFEVNKETGMHNFDDSTLYDLEQLDEIFLYPPTKKYKNYFVNLYEIKMDLATYTTFNHFDNKINNSVLIN